jgi:glutaredoxin 3
MTNVRIYTTTVCPFCHAAKQLLQSLGAEFEEVNLDLQPELRQGLSERLEGWKTVPMVFVGDEFLGGFQEMLQLHRDGQLVPRLDKAASPEE